MNSRLWSALAFVVAGAGMVYLLSSRQFFAVGVLPAVVQVAAALLMIWARLTFGRRSFHATANTTAGGLVTNGPYRYWRHPIYAAIIWFIWAGQVYRFSPIALLVCAIVSLALFARMLMEERELRRAYPDYAAYARKAKRLIPYVF